MKTVAFVAAVVLMMSSGFAEVQRESRYFAEEDFKRWVGEIERFDEIRMSLAHRDAELYEEARTRGVDPEELVARTPPLYSAQLPNASASFIALFEFQPNYRPAGHGCRGLFNLRFMRQGKVVGGLHYAHQRYWAPLTSRSQEAVNGWLADKGFPIVETLKSEHRAPLNQHLRATGSVTPRASSAEPTTVRDARVVPPAPVARP